MMFDDFRTQHVSVDMCINLRGGDGLMSQHTLDSPQVGTAFKKMSRERVSECMWTDVFLNTRYCSQFFYHVEYHNARQVRPSSA